MFYPIIHLATEMVNSRKIYSQLAKGSSLQAIWSRVQIPACPRIRKKSILFVYFTGTEQSEYLPVTDILRFRDALWSIILLPGWIIIHSIVTTFSLNNYSLFQSKRSIFLVFVSPNKWSFHRIIKKRLSKVVNMTDCLTYNKHGHNAIYIWDHKLEVFSTFIWVR